MRSALARLRAYGGALECEVDSVAATEWDRIAGEFDDVNDDRIASHSARQWGHCTSHLLLRRNGGVVAGARVAVVRLPGLRRGLALLDSGPLWRRPGEPPDTNMYRAVIGALVQEYCLRRSHCLTIVPRSNPEFQACETRELSDFGFTRRLTGEHDYWSRPSARITGQAIYALCGLRRSIRRWRRGLTFANVRFF